MKIALTSDTHYGFDHNTHKIHEKFLVKLAKDIKEQDVKLLIHAGDWAGNKQDQLMRTLKMFRLYIDIPIVTVLGNHDLWQYEKNPNIRKKTLAELNVQHNEWFSTNKIHYLENGLLVIEDVAVVGYNGWYNSADPPTNDSTHMVATTEGVPTMMYLANQTYAKLDSILQIDLSQYRKAIMVTHMPPFTENSFYLMYCANPKYFQPIKDIFDVFCVGHSHKYWNEVQDGCLILNSGSDYNKPAYTIFEV